MSVVLDSFAFSKVNIGMTKKYRGKPCTYCSVRTAETADHVFAREFFLPAQRANLPKVPACRECNEAKSQLEHYLTAVLPFGARHPGAATSLSEMVPPRLAKNARLERDLSRGAVLHGHRVRAVYAPGRSLYHLKQNDS